MKRMLVLGIIVVLFASSASGQDSKKAAAPESVTGKKETRYLAFQIFTYGPNPLMATMGEGQHPQPAIFPDKAVLRDYIEDIKGRIGTVGDRQTRLAVVLGHVSFDHGDAETIKFIELGFELALETDVAVGFHIDDSMFWAKRKDLLSDPNNVEALDWDGTPSTGRILNWGKEPSAAPPQMCFNSKVIQREVRQRSALIGKAIQVGVKQLEQRNRPELFAGVIAGSETQIGQDFKTGKYLGYRALLNRGFSREHPPQDMDLERESVVQEFIELWTTGLADAGVSPQRIYSHICFLSRRSFGLGDSKDITYMQRKGEITYSQHIHFTPPSVAFGKHHRPGFSTYPQPGLFDDIYEQLARHKQVGWASCEGTNMQPESGPGQSGMNMETYLAKMFNHGGTLVTIFSWGVGGEANKNMGFRVVTEGAEALQTYRKFLKGKPLIEGTTVASLTERLPPKIHRIQRELPAWMQNPDNKEKAAEAAALMQQMQDQLKAKNFEEVEKTADSILKLMGVSVPAARQGGENKPQQAPPTGSPSNDTAKRLTEKIERVKAGAQKWAASGRDPSDIAKAMQEKFKPLIEAGKVVEAEAELDRVLEQLTEGTSTPPAARAIPQETSSYEERLPPKIHKIQKELPAWIEKPGNQEKAAAFMQKLKEHLDAQNFAEAEKTADSILQTMGLSAPTATQSGDSKSPQAPSSSLPSDDPTKRITEKVERIKEGARKWAEIGRDPSPIAKAMEEKVKPLFDAGRPLEAEAELDRILEQLNKGGKSTETPTSPAQPPSANPSEPASVPLREIIVSYADETNKLQLYRVNEDGSARRRITDGTHDCSFPAWSPDGKKIVYVRGSGNDRPLWLSDPDGKNPKMLTGSGLNMVPSWLPDSKQIVWMVLAPGKNPAKSSQLSIMNTETLQARPLFGDPEQVKFSNMMPEVSPDGTKVVFVSNRSGHFRIWLSNLDGSDARPISPAPAELDETLQLPIEQKVPSWSPDGRWIAHWEGVEMDYLSSHTGNANPQRDALINRSWNVWIVDSDGKNKRKAGHGDNPNWSPDGFVTRAFPDPEKGGANVMIESKDGWKELPIVPAKTLRYGRFTWKP